MKPKTFLQSAHQPPWQVMVQGMNGTKRLRKVASQLLGDKVKPENVIGETLTRVTGDCDIQSEEFIEKLKQRVLSGRAVAHNYEEFVEDPIAMWVETQFEYTKSMGVPLKEPYPDPFVVARVLELNWRNCWE